MARRLEAASARLVEDLGRALFRARRLLWTRAAGRLETRGESILAFQMLGHLQRYGPTSQGEIATATAQHPTGVSRLLEELERGGFVRRARDSRDRRKLRVKITALGVARLEEARPEVLAAVDEVLRPLAGAERRSLGALLEKLIAGNPA
jgi:MarR family 2-MHQ and catechol resistance regulon transcriptional repressor